MTYNVRLRVNGAEYFAAIEPDRTLLSLLRRELGFTGPKEGCDDSECGACMVLLDGAPVNSCCYLAVQAADREVITVEGVGDAPAGFRIQARLLEEGGVQCGFCTPGIVISATALLLGEPHPSEEEIRMALAGNLCRCTGYQKIVSAVAHAAADLQ